MNRNEQRGIALIITLIMLSVVTITAVAFLAVTRQDRASVGAAAEQLDAQFAAETALQRAQSEIAGRITGSSNRFQIDLLVSTNWINNSLNLAQLQALADDSLNLQNPNILTNATAYFRPDGRPVFNSSDVQLYRASLMNLYFDPRAPVFAQVSRSPLVAPEFRYYLDLNRNGVFDTNGVQAMFNQRGQIIGTNELAGDPQWIAVREHSDAMHSGTNRFLMRYAYLILPAGKTLDINHAHNEVKFRRTDGSGFLRNQGVGAWEVNLGGFLADLNTNIWKPTGSASLFSYQYRPALASVSSGIAFTDADRLFRSRRGLSVAQSPNEYYASTTPFGFDGYDSKSDGPIPLTLAEFRRPQDLYLASGSEDAVGLLGWARTTRARSMT